MNTTLTTARRSLAYQGWTRRERLIGGVCSGIAHRLGTDIWAVRLAVIVLAMIIHPLPMLYLAAWILLPQASEVMTPATTGPVGTSMPVSTSKE